MPPRLASQNSSTQLRLDSLEERSLPSVSALGVASPYNVFVFKDYTSQYSDIEGRLAVGRNATLNGYAIGEKVSGGDELVVGGHLNFHNGQVFGGNTVYGTSANLSWFGSQGGTVRQGSVLNFDAAKTELIQRSQNLAMLQANGSVVNQWGGLTLTGTRTDTNVFSLKASDLAVWGITIKVPQGSSVIINVSGSTATMQYFGFNLQGVDASKILFNFHEAKHLTMQGIGIPGSILAPLALVNFSNGQMNGTLVADSYCGNGQFNHVPTCVATSSLQGTVFEIKCDCTILPLHCVSVTIKGRADCGDYVCMTVKTDAYGVFRFDNLKPGTYKISVALPSGFKGAKITAGSLGGDLSDLSVTVRVGSNVQGSGYQFQLLRA